MGYKDEKRGSVTFSASSLSPRDSEYLSGFEKKDLAYKKRIRILRFVTRSLSLVINAGMIGILSFTLARYFLTKNKIIAGNVHPWVTPATLWPTFMLLGIAVVTFFMNLINVCAYMCGVDAANKAYSCTKYVTYALTAAHVVAWAVAIGLFKMAQTESSLWGYTCSSKADQIQAQVQSYLDFGKLCTMQNGAWYMSILEGITYFLTFIVTIMMIRRASTKKKMSRARESFAMETGYNHGGVGQESGTTYAGRQYMPVAKESRF